MSLKFCSVIGQNPFEAALISLSEPMFAKNTVTNNWLITLLMTFCDVVL